MAKGTVNKVILLGRLGADPDVRFTGSGTAIASINVATTETTKKDDQWEEQTEWHRVVVFGKNAENCGTYLRKGSQLYIEGSLRTRQWEDKDGVKRYTTEIIAREVQFIGSKDGDGAGSKSGESKSHSSGSKSNSGGFDDTFF